MSKTEQQMTAEASFYCNDCKEDFDLIVYHGIPVTCPECGSANVYADEFITENFDREKYE